MSFQSQQGLQNGIAIFVYFVQTRSVEIKKLLALQL